MVVIRMNDWVFEHHLLFDNIEGIATVSIHNYFQITRKGVFRDEGYTTPFCTFSSRKVAHAT